MVTKGHVQKEGSGVAARKPRDALKNQLWHSKAQVQRGTYIDLFRCSQSTAHCVWGEKKIQIFSSSKIILSLYNET